MTIYLCEEHEQVGNSKVWIVKFATKSLERALAWEAEDDDNRVITKVELKD